MSNIRQQFEPNQIVLLDRGASTSVPVMVVSQTSRHLFTEVRSLKMNNASNPTNASWEVMTNRLSIPVDLSQYIPYEEFRNQHRAFLEDLDIKALYEALKEEIVLTPFNMMPSTTAKVEAVQKKVEQIAIQRYPLVYAKHSMPIAEIRINGKRVGEIKELSLKEEETGGKTLMFSTAGDIKPPKRLKFVKFNCEEANKGLLRCNEQCSRCAQNSPQSNK